MRMVKYYDAENDEELTFITNQMVFGMLPLVFAHGVGANGNISLGVGCAGGMFVGTIALIFVVPVLYMPFQWLHSRFGHMVKK